jgi:hypothetical protein
MIAEVLMATVPSLLMRLTEEFFAKRRDGVDVRELQEQVARLVMEKNSLACELAEVRRAVLVLTRYLVLTRQDVFVLEADQLGLTDQFQRDRETHVAPVIDNFGTRVEQSIQKRQDHLIEAFRRRQPKGQVDHEDPPVPEVRHLPVRYSDDFLEGFAEEILDIRLGRDGRQS